MSGEHLPELPSRLEHEEQPSAAPATAPLDRLTEAAALLPNLMKLVYRLLRDPRVPVRGRAFALFALGYLVSPVDLIPDFVPILGQADDVVVVVLALHHLLRKAGDEVVTEHWDGHGDVIEIVDGVLAVAAQAVPWRVRAVVRRLVR